MEQMLIASVKMQILYRAVFDGFLVACGTVFVDRTKYPLFGSSLVTGTDILGNSSEFVSLVGNKYSTTKTK